MKNSSLNGHFLKVLSLASIAGLMFCTNADTAFAQSGVVTGGASGIVVNGGTRTITNNTMTNYTKTESKKNPSGTSMSNPYLFNGGAVLRVLQDATADMASVNLVTGNTYTNTLTFTTTRYKYTAAYGGLIANEGALTNTDNVSFVGNTVTINTVREGSMDASSQLWGGYNTLYGGIIGNRGTIGNIGTLQDNVITGALTNSQTTATIRGGLICNSTDSTHPSATIGDVTGGITNNTITSGTYLYGGLIYNYASSNLATTIGDISGGITDNNVTSYSSLTGGMIYNAGSASAIGDIAGGIKRNIVKSTSQSASGGLIYNSGVIGDISGGISGNKITASVYIKGGLLSNTAGSNSTAEIGNISGGIKNNTVTLSSSGYSSEIAAGGLIYNYGSYTNATAKITSIDEISNNVINIQVQKDIQGGLISNLAGYSNSTATIGNIINGIFNNRITTSAAIQGGLISNGDGWYGHTTSTIENISGGLTNNTVYAGKDVKGGLIYNYRGPGINIAEVTLADSNVTGNVVTAKKSVSGGLIHNDGAMLNLNAEAPNIEISNNIVSGLADLQGGLINNTGGSRSNDPKYATINLAAGVNENEISATGSAEGWLVYNDGYINWNNANANNNTFDGSDANMVYNKGLLDINSAAEQQAFISNNTSNGAGAAIYNYGESIYDSYISDSWQFSSEQELFDTYGISSWDEYVDVINRENKNEF